MHQTGFAPHAALTCGSDEIGLEFDRGKTGGAFGQPAAYDDVLDQVEAELRAVMLLVGAGNVRSLRKAQVVLSGDLPRWAALIE